MRVGISQRVVQGEKGSPRDALEQDYVGYYTQFGFTIIPILNVLSNVQSYVQELSIERIILSGGNDIDPSLYDGTATQLSSHATQRDKTEHELLRFAESQRIPVLAICRGLQFMNVYFGGKLRQIEHHVGTSHKVSANKGNEPPSGLDVLEVNSYHSFGIGEVDVATSLKIFARAEDGTIEGLYHPKFPIAGIMWHPERPSPHPTYNSNLVEAFSKESLFWAK